MRLSVKRILNPKVQGQLRHLLSAFGPVLAMNGHMTDAEWQLYVGLFMAALAFVSSWFAKEKRQ